MKPPPGCATTSCVSVVNASTTTGVPVDRACCAAAAIAACCAPSPRYPLSIRANPDGWAAAGLGATLSVDMPEASALPGGAAPKALPPMARASAVATETTKPELTNCALRCVLTTSLDNQLCVGDPAPVRLRSIRISGRIEHGQTCSHRRMDADLSCNPSKPWPT